MPHRTGRGRCTLGVLVPVADAYRPATARVDICRTRGTPVTYWVPAYQGCSPLAGSPMDSRIASRLSINGRTLQPASSVLMMPTVTCGSPHRSGLQPAGELGLLADDHVGPELGHDRGGRFEHGDRPQPAEVLAEHRRRCRPGGSAATARTPSPPDWGCRRRWRPREPEARRPFDGDAGHRERTSWPAARAALASGKSGFRWPGPAVEVNRIRTETPRSGRRRVRGGR